MNTYCVASSRYKRNENSIEIGCFMVKMDAASEEDAIGIYLREAKKDLPGWEIAVPSGCILVINDEIKEESKKTSLREIANKYRDEKTPSLLEWGGISEFVFWAETQQQEKQEKPKLSCYQPGTDPEALECCFTCQNKKCLYEQVKKITTENK